MYAQNSFPEPTTKPTGNGKSILRAVALVTLPEQAHAICQAKSALTVVTFKKMQVNKDTMII
jgi:hypothetical protein